MSDKLTPDTLRQLAKDALGRPWFYVEAARTGVGRAHKDALVKGYAQITTPRYHRPRKAELTDFGRKALAEAGLLLAGT